MKAGEENWKEMCLVYVRQKEHQFKRFLLPVLFFCVFYCINAWTNISLSLFSLSLFLYTIVKELSSEIFQSWENEWMEETTLKSSVKEGSKVGKKERNDGSKGRKGRRKSGRKTEKRCWLLTRLLSTIRGRRRGSKTREEGLMLTGLCLFPSLHNLHSGFSNPQKSTPVKERETWTSLSKKGE